MVQTFVKRPTSPLHFEPLEPDPEDVLWPGSDDEADEEKREKKRLRIEILGKQYLEGRPLFIQTAGLRGPFNEGWVNPWASKKSEASRAANRLLHAQAEPRTVSSTAKRRSIVKTNVGHSGGKAADQTILEEPEAKRRRHDQTLVGSRPSAVDSRRTPTVDSRSGVQDDWLKRDHGYIHSRSRSGRASPTPTPTIRPRSRPGESPPPIQRPSAKVDALRKSPAIEKHSSSDDVYASGSTAINNQPHAGDFLARPMPHGSTHMQPHESSGTRTKQHTLPSTNGDIKTNLEGASEEASMRATALKERLFKARKPVSLSPARASPDIEKPTLSRLAPYVSDFVKEAAVSATLRAANKVPKPSPRAASSSTNLSEFQYRYSRRERSLSPFKAKPSYSTALRQSDLRARSISTSSSGSSDFAEAFEAAQAKAASGPSVSSHSSSPIVQRPETKSVKKNTQAMRRLTFTASGEPKIAALRGGSSLPSSSSSAAASSALNEKRKVIKSERSDEYGKNQKASTKSLDRSLSEGTTANHSRNSVVLPEAQLLPDAPIKLPQGPSTELLETDKQSPNFVSLEEEDSYFDLSTQAAVIKAQRAFKDEVLSPLKTPKQAHKVGMSPSSSRLERSKPTPTVSAYPKSTTVFKAEPLGDEEPMSTQAIADAISPFAVTTIKKRAPLSEKRASFVPSPTLNRRRPPDPASSPDPSPIFRKPLSMATTPSNSQPKPTPTDPPSHPKIASKPPSSLTSFSMLPNGTMTETSILQDGQQPQHDFDVSLPLDPFSTPFATARGNGEQQLGSYDLDAAIEEAGSFLGDWDVEAEARKEGSKRREAGPRGILSTGKRS